MSTVLASSTVNTSRWVKSRRPSSTAGCASSSASAAASASAENDDGTRRRRRVKNSSGSKTPRATSASKPVPRWSGPPPRGCSHLLAARAALELSPSATKSTTMSSHCRCRGVSSPDVLPANHDANCPSSAAERCCSSSRATCRETSSRERGRRLGGSAAKSWISAVNRPSRSAACCISVNGCGHAKPSRSSRVSPGTSSTTRSQASAASSSVERRSASTNHAGRASSATSMPVSQTSC